jgi:hypothetical protein
LTDKGLILQTQFRRPKYSAALSKKKYSAFSGGQGVIPFAMG